MSMLAKIQQSLNTLSKSEQKVAKAILADPAACIHLSIAVLAQQAAVSEPTVNRFCHRLGAQGFPDFKLQLAQSLAKGVPFVSRDIDPTDTPPTFSNKIFDSAMAALSIARNHLDLQVLEQVIEDLSAARQLSFFGFGASASVAHDAQNKFLRFATPVFFSDDPMMQRMVVTNAQADDVIICISHTGRTKAICDIAAIARLTPATVVGITAANSPLAQHCHRVLSTHVPEDTDLYMPMASRIAQLVLVDVLVTGYTLRRGTDFRDQLRLIKESLRESRYDK